MGAVGALSDAVIPSEGDLPRLVVEAAPNAMIMVDGERRIALVNRAAEVLFGYPRDELIGQPLEMLVPDRYRKAHPGHVAAFHRSPRARGMGAGRELFGRRKDGSEVPIEIGLNPIDTAEGRFTLAAIIDISERKRAGELFRVVVEAAPSAMLMIDRMGRIAMANRRAEDLFGYPRRELMGLPIEQLLPDRLRAGHPAHVDAFFRSPQARAMGGGRDLYCRRQDGVELPVEIGLSPIETIDGQFTLASIIDITERRYAEIAQERLAAIVESSEDAIVSKTTEGVITSWNRGAEQLFGFTAEEVIGRTIFLLVPERLVEEEQRIMAQIRRGERVEHFETVRRRKDGSEVFVSLQVSPLRNAAGEVVGGSKIARDITEAKRRDAELKRSNAELEQFAYIASHDLQEPLRMVANYTELLAERYKGRLDEKADKYIHYASDGARRMQRLVSDLLSYSRVGSQGRPLEPLSAGAAVEKVLQSLQRLIGSAQAVIEVEPLPQVMADEGQLQQLFQNLISNAIKFRSEAPPHIRIAATPMGTHWTFSVADNGIGMEMRHAERIFQMFQRLHEVGKYEGSGIGLAIAKRIVERHGGAIWLESEPGKGSTFRFTLKAVGERPA